MNDRTENGSPIHQSESEYSICKSDFSQSYFHAILYISSDEFLGFLDEFLTVVTTELHLYGFGQVKTKTRMFNEVICRNVTPARPNFFTTLFLDF